MTTSFASAPDHVTTLRRASVGALLVLCANAPAMSGDDVAILNYLNNVAQPHSIYYYNGYVPLIAELPAFLLSPLPIAWQAIGYRIVPLACALILFWQMMALLRERLRERDAWLCAFGGMLILRAFEPDLFGNLTHAPWTAVMAATLFVLRARRPRWSSAAAFAVWLAAVSHPIGALLALVLIYQWFRSSPDQRSGSRIGVAVAILVVTIYVTARAPDAIVSPKSPATIFRTLAAGFRDHKLATLVAAVATATLAAIVATAGRRETRTIWPLAFVGIAGVFAYLFTDRFLFLEGFEPRYVIPVLVCAWACAALSTSAFTEPGRSLIIGISFGAALMATAVVQFTELRGPLETALLKYRFLAVADDFRRTCRDDETMLFEFNPASPIVLCRPRALPPPFYAVTNVPPSIGVDEHRSTQTPGIQILSPLF